MDPENVRTLVSGVVTVTVGVVPALLLYMQNVRSNEREASERREQRTADASAAIAAREAAERAAERARLLRLAAIADKIGTALITAPTSSPAAGLVSGDDRRELVEAYTDVMTTGDSILRTDAENLRRVVTDLIVKCADFDGPVTWDDEKEFVTRLSYYRSTIRSAILQED